jgi:hypothetical protein
LSPHPARPIANKPAAVPNIILRMRHPFLSGAAKHADHPKVREVMARSYRVHA